MPLSTPLSAVSTEIQVLLSLCTVAGPIRAAQCKDDKFLFCSTCEWFNQSLQVKCKTTNSVAVGAGGGGGGGSEYAHWFPLIKIVFLWKGLLNCSLHYLVGQIPHDSLNLPHSVFILGENFQVILIIFLLLSVVTLHYPCGLPSVLFTGASTCVS